MFSPTRLAIAVVIGGAAQQQSAATRPPVPSEVRFPGLLYTDGVDTLGRPVIVINADAVPHNYKSASLEYLRTTAAPIVNNVSLVSDCLSQFLEQLHY